MPSVSTIRDPRVRLWPPLVQFTWTPLVYADPYIIAGNWYPSDLVPAIVVGQETTFTANVVLNSADDQIAEYFWRFGDGGTAYGPVVKHTYTIALPQTRIVLCVTNRQGRRHCAGQQVSMNDGLLDEINLLL